MPSEHALTLVDAAPPAEATVVSAPPWAGARLSASPAGASVLFLASQPHTHALLRQDHEHRAIRQALHSAPHGAPVPLASEWAVPVHDLQTALLAHAPRIVHLSTHGEPSGDLLLADDAGCQPLEPAALAALFSLFSRSVHLVVLGACFSARAARAASAHIPAVIGMDGPIDDRAAIVFAAALYRGLAFGRSVAESFQLARCELALQGAPDADLPRLFSRPDVDARALSLPPPSPLGAPAGHAHLPPNPPVSARGMNRPPMVGVPALAARHIGRQATLDALERAFIHTRDASTPAALCIHGLPGMGKSEIAARLCHRLAARRSHPGGIFWLDARAGDLAAGLGQEIADALDLPAAPLPERAALAARALERTQERVLLVLDDAPTWPLPGPHTLPRGPHIDLLVTTDVRRLGGTRFHHSSLDPLTMDEARALFTSIAPHATRGLDALLAHLAGHPLAIELAASHLADQPERTPDQYLAELDHLGHTVHGQTGEFEAHEHAIHVALAALWQRLDAPTRDAWLRASCFARSGASLALAERVGLDSRARQALRRAHLIDVTPERTLRMHGLARDFARRAGTRAERHAARRAFVIGCEAWMHEVAGWLDSPAGFAMFLAERENLIDYALRMAESLYPDSAPLLASLRAHVAMGCHAAGDLDTARALLERALAAQPGDNPDPHVDHWRARLALVYSDAGRFERALALIDDALAARAPARPPAELIERRAQKARILAGRAELAAQARDLLVRCLDDELRMRGPEHPACARRRVELALVLRDLGELERARINARTALDQLLAAGVDERHRAVTEARAALGTVLVDMGRVAAGHAHIERALADTERDFGPEHPAVGALQGELAWASFLLGPDHHERARELLETSVRTAATLTHGHALTLHTGHTHTAWTTHAQRRRTSRSWQRALTALAGRLGEHHPRIAALGRQVQALEQRCDHAATIRCA